VSLGDEVLAVVTRGLLGAVESRGLDRAALLREAGLSEAAVEQPDRWVPIARHLRVGHALAAAFPGTNVGLQTGAPIYSDPRGALGYCLRRSQVHRRALASFAAYIQIVNRAVRMVFLPVPTGSALVLEMLPQMAAAGHPAESLLAAWLSLSRYLTGTVWQPLAVELAHQPMGDVEEHELLFGCPVRFGRAQTRLIFSEAALELPIAALPHEFEGTVRRAGKAARSLVASDEASRASLSALLEQLGGTPLHLEAVRAHASPDRLGARLALGRALLETSRTLVHEAAYLLGFESLGCFERAYCERFGSFPVPRRVQN
jgi:AraC-like DNA-binding protein